jgi:cytochrome d ubiquinol oxidase subunit I
VPHGERPPVNLVRYAFQSMVGIGLLLALLGLVFLYLTWRRRRLPENPWFYRALVVAGPLAFVALIAGWTTTEVGRQPWTVYQVMRTSQAVTGASGIPIGYGVLATAYALLAAGTGWALWRLSRTPTQPARPDPELPAPEAA